MNVGDTLTLALNSIATANTGFVNRNQNELVSFYFSNLTDDGSGTPEPMSFLFNYSVSYTTSLSNDVAGDQALGSFGTKITTSGEDENGDTVETTFEINFDPMTSQNEIFESHFGTGTVSPSGTSSGSFSLDVSGPSPYFEISATAATPTNINAVPLPAAAWLFGSGLLGLIGMAKRKAA